MNLPAVACVLRSGGIYDADWVRRLRRGVERHTQAPHRFVCMSDVWIDGIETIPLVTDWPGWWAKIELFRRFALDGRPVLYLDLDCVVLRDLSPLLGIPLGRTLWMCRDFVLDGRVNSSVMAFNGGAHSHLFDRFSRESAHWLAPGMREAGESDQTFVERASADEGHPIDLIQRCFGLSSVLSYRLQCSPETRPDARIVAFHGSPKPHECDSPWVRAAW